MKRETQNGAGSTKVGWPATMWPTNLAAPGIRGPVRTRNAMRLIVLVEHHMNGGIAAR